jgi:predicted acylesterase/phospholipase RssA
MTRATALQGRLSRTRAMMNANRCMKALLLMLSVVPILNGCALNAYQNIQLGAGDTNKNPKATHRVANRNGSAEDTLVILALSGGGSRAAYFSASTMLSLEQNKILKEVDVISSVSGGSLPAAYYAISKDPDEAGPGERLWEEKTVKDLMARNYKMLWFGNWFWPNNILKYWFTSFNRSHIMAQTFADNLFDSSTTGIDYKFKDLNQNRPSLIINATNGTTGKYCCDLFTFTEDDFNDIDSNLNEYDLSLAVMSSASFPSVFNYINLRNFKEDETFIHVFDGGNTDNLGLKSTFWLLNKVRGNFRKIILILVDSYTMSDGVSGDICDARGSFDFVMDLNFLDSFNCLLALNRESLVQDMINYFSWLKTGLEKDVVFYHIKFDNIKALDNTTPEEALYPKLNSIKTDFQISDHDKNSIDKAANLLLSPTNNTCLNNIKQLLFNNRTPDNNSTYCTWPPIEEDTQRVQEAMHKKQ